MEAFQSAFYGEGRDVLAPVQMRIANVDGDALYASVRRPRGTGRRGSRTRKAPLDILGDFVVYPTLTFLNGRRRKRRVLARGYADYPVGRQAASVLGGGRRSETRPPTRTASAGIAIFRHEGRIGEGFSKKLPPQNPLPQKLRFVGRPLAVRSVKEKLPILWQQHSLCFINQNRPACRAGLFYLPKVGKEGFDNIESTREEEPGGGTLRIDAHQSEDAPNHHSPVGSPSLRPCSNLPADYDCRTAHDDLPAVGRRSPMRAAGRPDQHGDDPLMMTSGGPAPTTESPIHAAGIFDKDARAAGRYRPAHMPESVEPLASA